MKTALLAAGCTALVAATALLRLGLPGAPDGTRYAVPVWVNDVA